jgi:hypothetical protein
MGCRVCCCESWAEPFGRSQGPPLQSWAPEGMTIRLKSRGKGGGSGFRGAAEAVPFCSRWPPAHKLPEGKLGATSTP